MQVFEFETTSKIGSQEEAKFWNIVGNSTIIIY